MNSTKAWNAVVAAAVTVSLTACGTGGSTPEETTESTTESTAAAEECPEPIPGDEFEDAPQSDIDGVEIDLATPEIEVEANRAETLWAPQVINDSGEDISDAVLEISVDRPSDCELSLTVANQPDECNSPEEIEEDPSCNERERTAEQCEYTEASGEDGVGSGARADCVKDVVAGDNEFTLNLRILDYEGDSSRLDDYPGVEVHTRLTVDDEVVASATAPVMITVGE